MNNSRTKSPSLFASQRHADTLHDINAQLSSISKIVDFTRLAAVLDSVVYANKGYASQAHRELLKVKGLRDKVQRRGSRGKALSACQESRNKGISKVRVRVEHPFASIKRGSGGVIRTIGLARAKLGMTMKALCYNLQRLTYMVMNDIDGFFYPKAL